MRSNTEWDPHTRQAYAYLEVFSECKATKGCGGAKVHFYLVDMTHLVSFERYLRVRKASKQLEAACRAVAFRFLATSRELQIVHQIKCCAPRGELVSIPSIYASELLTKQPIVFRCVRKSYEAYNVRCPVCMRARELKLCDTEDFCEIECHSEDEDKFNF